MAGLELTIPTEKNLESTIHENSQLSPSNSATFSNPADVESLSSTLREALSSIAAATRTEIKANQREQYQKELQRTCPVIGYGTVPGTTQNTQTHRCDNVFELTPGGQLIKHEFTVPFDPKN